MTRPDKWREAREFPTRTKSECDTPYDRVSSWNSSARHLSPGSSDQSERPGNNAIDAYRRGFLADQRDAYPGVNLLTLLDVKGDEKSLVDEKRLLPVVRFAVERRLAGGEPDYWDHATMLELAVLEGDPNESQEHLANAVAAIRETWEPGTTANNLRIVERARESRGVDTGWITEIITYLEARAK